MSIAKFWINFLIGVALLFIAVWLFTRPSFVEGFNLIGKGEIGDVIGGITTPIISLAGAILVYLSFKEQITANKIQRKSLENEIEQNKIEKTLSGFMNEFSSLKADISNLKFTYYDDGIRIDDNAGWSEHDGVLYPYHGIEAVEKYLRILPLDEEQEVKCGILYDLQFILVNFISLFHSVHENKIISFEQKKDLLDKLLLFHYTKFKFVLGKINHLNKKNEAFKKKYSFFDLALKNSEEIIEIHKKEYKKKQTS